MDDLEILIGTVLDIDGGNDFVWHLSSWLIFTPYHPTALAPCQCGRFLEAYLKKLCFY